MEESGAREETLTIQIAKGPWIAPDTQRTGQGKRQ